MPDFRIFIEIFQLFEIRSIIDPIIKCYFDNPLMRNITAGILYNEMKSLCNAKKRRYYIIIRRNAINYYYLFPIIRLNNFWFINLIGLYNDYTGPNYSYYETRFIEIVDIGILNVIFCLGIRNEPKPRV